MGGIKLSEHLTEHVREIEIVGNIRQELLILCLVAVPVYSVDIRIVEFLLDLSPGVVKYVLPLSIRPVLEDSLHLDRSDLAAVHIDLLDGTGIHKDTAAVVG